MSKTMNKWFEAALERKGMTVKEAKAFIRYNRFSVVYNECADELERMRYDYE